MKKKYNDKSQYFKDWTTKKLKQEAKAYDQAINGDCGGYGTRDLMALDGILDELYDRGIEPNTSLRF